MGSNIYIISDAKKLAEDLQKKIILVRKNDKIETIDFWVATNKIDFSFADLVLVLLENNEDFVKLKNLTFNESLKKTTCILTTNTDDENIIFDAFDLGISDFMNFDSSQSQILIKIMAGLKRTQLIKRISKQNEILSSMNIIDSENNFFTQIHSQQAFSKEFEIIEKKNEPSVFMEISADIKFKNILPISMLANAIKKAIRNEDIVGYSQDNRIGIILHNTDSQGANVVFTKIQEKLGESYTISGAATNITDKDFYSSEKLTSKALSNALIKSSSFVFVDKKVNKSIANWLDKSDLKETNFMLFKQSFITKFTKIAAPVFFQKQTVLQNKLFESKVIQKVAEEESIFSIEKGNYKSQLLIKYPGYAKINIEISHKSSNDNKIKRIMIDINELTQNILENIIDEMTKQFQELQNEN